LKNMIARANSSRPFDYHMGGDIAAFTNLNIRANRCPGANRHVVCDLGGGINYGTWMNH
jgi:hypothetical protein